jgi:hypothetical protein
MRDYISDYQTYLNPSLLELLVEDLFDSFLVIYLTALVNTQKLRMPAAVERIKDAAAELSKFFSTLKPAKELESCFEVVEMVLSLLEASKSLAFSLVLELCEGALNLAFVEGLMKARGIWTAHRLTNWWTASSASLLFRSRYIKKLKVRPQKSTRPPLAGLHLLFFCPKL